MHEAFSLTNLLQGIILLTIGGVAKVLYSMNQHLAKLNGRIGKVEVQQATHEQIDVERLQDRKAQADECRRTIRREIDDLRNRVKS